MLWLLLKLLLQHIPLRVNIDYYGTLLEDLVVWLPGCAPLSWASTIWAIWALSFASSVSSTLIFWMAASLATDDAWGSLVSSCRLGRDLRRVKGLCWGWGWWDRNTNPACIPDLLQLEAHIRYNWQNNVDLDLELFPTMAVDGFKSKQHAAVTWGCQSSLHHPLHPCLSRQCQPERPQIHSAFFH